MHSYTSRIRAVMVSSALLLGSLLLPCTATTNMPFSDSFDSYTNNQPLPAPWQISDPSVAASTNRWHGASGKSAYVPQDQIASNTFNDSRTRVWTDLYAVPKLYDGVDTNRPPDTNGTATALFFFNSNGYAVVHGAYTAGQTNWTVYNNHSQLTGGWTRVTVFHNYAATNWALFVARDGVTEELVAQGLSFMNPTPSNYKFFAVRDDVYFDDVGISTNLPTGMTHALVNSMGAAWLLHYFGTTNVVPNGIGGDADGDGLSNLQEYQLGTNPLNNDTDGDGMPDGWEVSHPCLSPTNSADGGSADFDLDNLPNVQEYNGGTNSTDPCNPDTDGDGMPDGWEVSHSLNPLVNDASIDSDGDGSTNLQEYRTGGDPHDGTDSLYALPYLEPFESPLALGALTNRYRAMTPSAQSVTVTNIAIEGLQSLHLTQ